jgi:hypothetical protein
MANLCTVYLLLTQNLSIFKWEVCMKDYYEFVTKTGLYSEEAKNSGRVYLVSACSFIFHDCKKMYFSGMQISIHTFFERLEVKKVNSVLST